MLNFWKGKGGAAIGQSKSRYAVFKQMLANKKRLLQNRPKGSFTAAVGFFYIFFGSGYSTPNVSTVISVMISGVFGLSP